MKKIKAMKFLKNLPTQMKSKCKHFLHNMSIMSMQGIHNTDPKGQLNSEWIYEVIVSPKMPTRNLKDFCPGSLLEVGILGETMTL